MLKVPELQHWPNLGSVSDPDPRRKDCRRQYRLLDGSRVRLIRCGAVAQHEWVDPAAAD